MAVDQPPVVNEDVIRQREEACKRCRYYLAASDKCGLCGCAFVIKDRVRAPWARCPDGTW